MGHFALSLATAPAEEPVTTAEAKTHLRVDHSDEDDLIAAQIVASRRWCESRQRRAYVTQTWDLFMDRFPLGGSTPIMVPRAPLVSVTHVKYHDEDGTEYTVSSGDYFVDTASEPGRIAPDPDFTWPTTTLRTVNGVGVRFVAGYGDESAVPDTAKQAILALVGTMYRHRESVVTGAIVAEIGAVLERLLAPDSLAVF